MLLKRCAELAAGNAWQVQLKLDGPRMITFKTGGNMGADDNEAAPMPFVISLIRATPASPRSVTIFVAPNSRARFCRASWRLNQLIAFRSHLPNREGATRSRIEYSPTSITMRNIDLNECIQWAYDIRDFQIAGSTPPDRYDIRATTANPVPVDRLRLMLQDLLATRFQFALHREIKPVVVYELLVAKRGPKLPPPKPYDPQHPVRSHEFFPRVEGDSFVFEDASLADFAGMLMQLRGVELPIIDRTGIPGRFDLILKSAPSAAREADTSLLFALIQDQFGLRLASAKTPMEVLVIDHAAKPSEN